MGNNVRDDWLVALLVAPLLAGIATEHLPRAIRTTVTLVRVNPLKITNFAHCDIFTTAPVMHKGECIPGLF